MGYAVTWIAVRGKEPAQIQREYGLEPTGEFEEIPESPIVGANLPGGWYLVFRNDWWVPGDAFLRRLSTGAELVDCSVEEHTMCSSAVGWKDGRQIWEAWHDAQQGSAHLEYTGDLPPSFAAIRDRLIARQTEMNDADYIFDIPVELAKDLTGFRHDEDIPGASAEPFELLRPIPAAKKWWQFWR
jgi:hypothetical protein